MKRSVLWGAVILTAVYFAARDIGHFARPQAIFLTALLVFAPLQMQYMRQLAAKGFEPFQLRIRTNYATVLMDSGLLADESEWKELLKANEDNESTGHLGDGLTCFLVSYDTDSNTHVIVWPDYKDYTPRLKHPLGQIDLRSLPLAAAFPAGCWGGNSRLKASFGIKPGRMGVQVFMRIDNRWWKQRWANSIHTKPPFTESSNWQGDIDLTVAVIPYAEFQFFYNFKPTWWSTSWKQRQHALKALGWKDQNYRIPGDQWVNISHRYLKVGHEALDRYL